jgi:hypothetical protein
MHRASTTLCLLLAAAALAAAPSPLEEMDNYLAKAQDSADNNHLSEAIRSYVTVLALCEENPSPSPAADAKAKEASTQLARIGTRLSLEPSGDWLDPKGTQIAGDSRKLGKDGCLSPAVYLFESFGTGKSPVGDAPIFFQFQTNSGSLVSFVTTDAYGKANTTVAKVEEPGKNAVIRAYPVFKARGKSYSFQSVFRDFSYLPPANVVRVLALESSDSGSNDNPGTADAVASVLKEIGFESRPLNAKLAPEPFRKAYGGDAKALASFGIDASSPYAALVLVDVSQARQMELNGKKYNIFTAATSINFRLVRADGSVVYSLPVDGVKGQGGTMEASVADAYKRARNAIGPELRKRLADLKDALTKE